MLDRDWLRLHRAHPEYEQGAWKFVQVVTKNLGYPEKILCPCIDCRSVSHQFGSSCRRTFGFYNKLSAIAALYRIKTNSGWSDKSFNELLEILPGMLPKDNVLLESVYSVKKFLKTFDMGSEKMGEDLRWHFNNKSNDGKMRHPVDSVTWDLVDDKWQSFSADPRNLRLGLATDGFNPFSMLSSKYSCWPVMLVTYNLPPMLCMKKENIMLTLLIPGPKQPGNDIDVYLQPLIEDLQHLWHNGVEVYDAFSKTVFNLRSILLWTINDFPAYGNLAGCCTKGRNISVALKDFPNDFGKCNSKKRKRNNNSNDGVDDDDDDDDAAANDGANDQDELSRWKKRSIFFDLPYWEELPLRHNLDVMHIEKNVCESIIGTILHSGKSKDGVNARKDLQDMQIRKDLHPELRGNRTYLPPAPWTFSRSEKKKFCKRLYDFKGPDGYCSNIGKCISLEECKIIGLKSHDYHVLMQQLLPVALRGLLPKGPRNAILRLCAFFNKLCQRVIDREKIAVLEEEVIETLCRLERFFPPSFFDIMVHLTVHLGREARLCGPVHFRWMYPFERYMKTLKDYVRNPARPEGCIAKSYLADECMSFCSYFLKKSIQAEEKEVRNDDFANEVILEGHPISEATTITLSDREKNIAHLAVLMNTAEVDPYLDLHLEELQESNIRLNKDATLLWKRHSEKFAEWIKNKIPIDSKNHSDRLKWIAYGPRNKALSLTGYIVNGQRFHTKDIERETQNSGVTYDATSMCRASAKDNAQVADLVTYYGILTDIILLDYHVFYVPVFKCHWANKGNGVKIEDGFTLVNLHQSQVSFARDPYILASQAKQVFYSREDDSSNWYVVLKAPPRGFHELETYDGNIDATSMPPENDMDMDDASEEVRYVREDCEGIFV
ncbi:hypothetical protein M0R45_013227 [Rubus argutus]|uniref:Transposase n=1 Tax=Rubus argutus TaxID=59490 RepID=A0AAW1XIJ5_RUBAR